MNTSITSLPGTPVRTTARPSVRGRHRGFTLVELLIVMAVAAILAGAAVPSMRSTLRSIELTSASNDLLGALLVTRSEAVKRNGRVVMCKSAAGLSCASTGGWEQGWLVFHDADNDGAHDAGEAVILHQQALSPDLRVVGNLNVARYVSYTAHGSTQLVSGGFQAGTITLCHRATEATAARQVIVSSAGRPRVQKSRVSSCA